MSDTTMPAPLVAIEHSGSAWNLTFEGFTEASAVGGFLWPDGVPAGVHILPLVVVEEPTQMGQFEFTGLTIDALQSMEPSIAERIEQESVMTADPPDTDDSSSATKPGAPAGDPPGTAPRVDVKMDESALAEYVHSQLEATSYIGDATEIAATFAAEGSVLASVAEILGPAGMVADTVIILWTVARAFGTGTRLQEQEGFCYGVMWETFGLPNGEKEFVLTLAGDSADDLRQAFLDGVAQGREKARDVKIHNAIMLAVAYYMAAGPASDAGILIKTTYNSGDHLGAGQELVLNDLWKKIRETGFTRTWLTWPKPEDMQP
jgi:hypothetical protein